ncbi:MAG: ribosome small subunit-dependent GTPase A [Candidatus Thermofonsia Clade 1 bacterium]|uniref:Small ribosomal subunit biogenesis GTPase RsgA n=1 Tax=Candidatus Thermofonsia Clade 1 bacterium TaxID=2364210 RepID=A0A2M8PY28_9CHLR|nr:MAG: ribosome small subunit-dependent GTPase A [Candidatus Thermofonsia Clade 1 bacterium]
MQKRDERGLVVKTQSGFYWVQTQTDLVTCQLRGTLKQAHKRTELCVIGDQVIIERLPDGRGVIKQILPRQRVLSRIEPSDYAGTSTEREQVLIANCDQAIFVNSAACPAPNTRFLDRCLVAAEKAGIPAVIVLNKIDLEGTEAARALFATYERIGYPVLYVSAVARIGLEALHKLLIGKISIFTGRSGVGKSSLLNAIQPDLGRAVGEISAKLAKGKHTTNYAEMVPLMGGGYVADTPGIRGLGLWDIEPDELDGYFPEFVPHIPNCPFSDCTHINEPECAVRAAVARGEIAEHRYESYLRLREELEDQYVY